MMEENNLIDFSAALHLIKVGKRLTRASWEDRRVVIYLVQGSVRDISEDPTIFVWSLNEDSVCDTHINVARASGQITTWVPVPDDLTAYDWFAVDKYSHDVQLK